MTCGTRMNMVWKVAPWLALCACKSPNLPSGLTPVAAETGGGRSFELVRQVEGVGTVTERVLSQDPRAVAAGACAGQMELWVPGAPGGAQRYLAHVGCGDGVPRVMATQRATGSGKLWTFEPTLDQMMNARALVLQDRSDGARWFMRDALQDARSWTGVLHAHGHQYLQPGHGVSRQMVMLLGMYSGFPLAGAQWDDVQVVLMDVEGNALARLTLDPMEVGTHAALQLRWGAQGQPVELAYVGMLRDATGAWRFVDLAVPVAAVTAEKVPGLAAAWNAAMLTRTTHVLSLAGEGATGHLWVDGQNWLEVEQAGGLLDEVVHQPLSMLGGELSLNPSPEESPLWMLAHAPSGSALLAYDVGVLGDRWNLLTRVPPAARTGWSHAETRFEAQGTRQVDTQALSVAKEYSSRVFHFELPTGQRMRLNQQLVAVQLNNQQTQFGLRQTAALEEP